MEWNFKESDIPRQKKEGRYATRFTWRGNYWILTALPMVSLANLSINTPSSDIISSRLKFDSRWQRSRKAPRRFIMRNMLNSSSSSTSSRFRRDPKAPLLLLPTGTRRMAGMCDKSWSRDKNLKLPRAISLTWTSLEMAWNANKTPALELETFWRSNASSLWKSLILKCLFYFLLVGWHYNSKPLVDSPQIN